MSLLTLRNTSFRILIALGLVGILAPGFCAGAEGQAAAIQTAATQPDGRVPAIPGGILQTVENASVTRTGDSIRITPKDPGSPVTMVFTRCQGVGVGYDDRQWWVLPISADGARIDANRALWVLPDNPASSDSSWHLTVDVGSLHAEQSGAGLTVTVDAPGLTLSAAEARPHSDPFGHRFSLAMDGGPQMEQALAAFYWGTMLPSVVEKTMAAGFRYSSGYVLSTLDVHAYAGSYPAVDHEFQIRGRLAIGSAVDLDVVRRMIGLQFRVMQDDPEHLYRDPTSVQPDGRREYHVRRDSEDHRQNAAMFPVTGNIEVIEEAWCYYAATKDEAWLRASIANLEHAAGWVLAQTDEYGRVWSDVYYEDQVIKDGRVTQAQAFAAHAFSLLAEMETRLGRSAEAARYADDSRRMSRALVAPLPDGYWDPEHGRFVDWVDRNAGVHDHLHLLANELPVTFGDASQEQAAGVRRLIEGHAAEFERFPSFVAAGIAAYTRSEIGTGGPYDLCAAGRYWYWDAVYRHAEKQNQVLLDQLKAVAAEAAKSGYYMSERYDMDDVYYVDGKDAHGAQKYYEYPNVFAAVLIDEYLGLSVPDDADVAVAPRLAGYGSAAFETPVYALRYSYARDGFTLTNLSGKTRRIRVDLSGLAFGAKRFRMSGGAGSVGPVSTVTLRPREEMRWTPLP